MVEKGNVNKVRSERTWRNRNIAKAHAGQSRPIPKA